MGSPNFNFELIQPNNPTYVPNPLLLPGPATSVDSEFAAASPIANSSKIYTADPSPNTNAKQVTPYKEAPKSIKDTVASASSFPSGISALASKSLFRRGISSVGSAFGVVANYINESFLSGIPFHIADRAMRESKETYAKWWEGGINNSNKGGTGGDQNHGSTDEEDMDEDFVMARDNTDVMGNGNMDQSIHGYGILDEVDPAAKRRRLESGKAFGVNVSSSYGSASRVNRYDLKRGSSLSQTLGKNFDGMRINSIGQTNRNQSIQQGNRFSSRFQPSDLAVDSSIIKPRRRNQFQNEKSTFDANSSGYDVFNNVGSMYGNDIFGGGTSSIEMTENKENDGATVSASKMMKNYTYDSIGSSYTNNDENEETTDLTSKHPDDNNNQQAATTATITVKNNSTKITSNITLDGTLRAIQEMLEEKNRVSEENEIYQMVASPRDWVTRTIRSELIDALQSAQGDVKDKRFLSSLEVLTRFYKASGRDARVNPWSVRRERNEGGGGNCGYSSTQIGGLTASDLLEGSWVNMSRPNYVECLGRNGEGDFMYTLGR